VRLSAINPGDMVRVSVRGRIFHGVVRGVVAGGLEVDPVERGITYRRVKAHDVLEHWTRRGRPRADGEKAVDPAQASFDELLDR
jgi:hypothetical protein